jgi:cytoskeletal protein CcmA (bactofilin family)
VNPSLATGILVVVEGALFLLPLLPALEELRLKSDAEPLNVIQKHSGDVRHFAYGFRTYIDELQEPLKRCVEVGTTVADRRKNGEEYILLGNSCEGSFLDLAKVKDSVCKLVICTGSDMNLPGGLNFLKEIYAAGRLAGGEGSTYRAILGEKDIHLQRDTKVMRWVHAKGCFRADHDCEMYGRVSSDQEILLQPGCMFQRLHAPRIMLGCAPETDHAIMESERSESRQFSATATRRRLVEGDVEIRSGEVIAEDIIARGKLHIGAGAKVLGSVKSNQDLVLDAGVSVAGSLISAGTLQIGPQCRVRGPVLAERRIEIGSGTTCGTSDSLTTVSSPIVDAQEGSVFFGTVWAREEGCVLSKS